MKSAYIIIFIMILTGCSCEDAQSKELRKHNLKGEYIYRFQNEHLFPLSEPQLAVKKFYPWDHRMGKKFPAITKEFFRCKGSSLNPPKIVQGEKESLRFYDCGGAQKHSLPLENNKEFIYPILIDILNYLQDTTGKRVVITSGHCCPDHNLYLDSSAQNQVNKHLLGAEVDFYIQGMEDQPAKVIDLILAYYKDKPRYKGMKDFEEFKRYEKIDTNVSITPWYNKEVYIKLFNKTEGRDLDNRHPYPYISIQVRYDWESDSKVNYSWDQAFRSFHRF